MAKVLVLVKGGMVVGVETDDASSVVRVVDLDIGEGEVSEYSWPDIQAGEDLERYFPEETE